MATIKVKELGVIITAFLDTALSSSASCGWALATLVYNARLLGLHCT